MKIKPDDAIEPVLLFSSGILLTSKMTRRMIVGLCSQPYFIIDRQVSKIMFYHQPMMREEQINQPMIQEEQISQPMMREEPVNKIVLHQVLYTSRTRIKLKTLQKMRAPSLC